MSAMLSSGSGEALPAPPSLPSTARSPVRQTHACPALTRLPSEAGLSPLWSSVKKLDLSGVQSALKAGANANERDAQGDTPLLMIARAGCGWKR
jgi:hypothetical protein